MYLKANWILIVLLIPLSYGCFAQGKLYKGRIKDGYKNRLFEVSIKVNGIFSGVVSDCDGRFQIMAKEGDTLTLHKKGYQERTIVLKNKRRLLFSMDFDYEYVRMRLNARNKGKVGKVYVSSQPIFLVNGLLDIDVNVESLTKDQVKSIKILKGSKAESFGKYAASGVVLIITECLTTY